MIAAICAVFLVLFVIFGVLSAVWHVTWGIIRFALLAVAGAMILGTAGILGMIFV